MKVRFSKRVLAVLLAVMMFVMAGCSNNEQPPVDTPTPEETADDVTYDANALQKVNSVIEKFPSSPGKYKMKDWEKTAKDFVEYVFDPTQMVDADYPILYLADTYNLKHYFGETETYGTDRNGAPIVNKTFVIPSYYGDERAMESVTGAEPNGEGVTAIGAVLTGAMMGYDMTEFAVGSGNVDYVKMLLEFFHSANGENVMANNSKSELGVSFWYDILPSAMFHQLAEYYPTESYMYDVISKDASVWCGVVDGVGGKNANFYHTSYSITEKTPVDNGTWTEPDAAAGIAYILYSTAKYISNLENAPSGSAELAAKCIERAKWCMDFLNKQEVNVLYEDLAYYAPYVAAMMNAELGTNYDVEKFLGWAFTNDSTARPTWGMVNNGMNGYGTYGLMGSNTMFGGYAFALGTFHAGSLFTSAVRYDGRFANIVGKYLMNAASASRLYYGSEVPESNQSCAEAGKKDNIWDFIGYEAIAGDRGDGISPNASGDPIGYNWTFCNTDIGLYGSAMVGSYGAVISTTNVDRILQLDVTAADFHSEKEYPSYMYYNPYAEEKAVAYSAGVAAVDVYNLLTGEYLLKNVSGELQIEIPAENSVLVAIVPAGATKTEKSGCVYFNDKFVGGAMKNNVGLDNVNDNERISGTKKLDVNAMYTGIGNKPQSMKITIGSETVYNGLYKKSINMDSTKYTNGVSRIAAEVTFKDGAKQIASKIVKIDNQKGADVFKYNASEIAEFGGVSVFPAGATYDSEKDCAVIRPEEGWEDPESASTDKTIHWGAVKTPLSLVDLYRYPQLEIVVDNVEFEFALQLFVEGEKWGEYLLANVGQSGTYVVDIRSALRSFAPLFKYNGVQNIEIWLLSVGTKAVPNKQYTDISVKSLRMYYMHDKAWEKDGSFEFGDTITPGQLFHWTNDKDNPSTLKYENGKAVISSTDKPMGGVISDLVTIDFDNLPTLEIELGKAKYGYIIKLFMEDGTSHFATLGTTVENDKVMVIDLLDSLKITASEAFAAGTFIGEKKARIGIYASGGIADKTTVGIGAIKTFYGKYPTWGEEIANKDIVKWNSAIHAGSSSLVNGNVVIKATPNAYGGIGSKFAIDFDKTPILELNVTSLNAQSWFLQMHFEGETNARYFFDNGATGITKINIKEKLQSYHKPAEEPALPELTGKKVVRIYFCAVDQVSGKTFTVEQIKTYYDGGAAVDDSIWGATFAPSSIGTWAAATHGGSAAANGDNVVISPAASGYGGVQKELTLDFDKKPILKIEGAATDGSWFMQMIIDGGEKYFYDRGEKGTVTIDVVANLKSMNAGIELSGVKTVKIQLCANGSKDLTLSKMSTYYGMNIFSPSDIAGFDTAHGGSAAVDGANVKILPNATHKYGGVSTGELTVNFDQTPTIVLKDVVSDGTYFLQIRVGGDDYYFYNGVITETAATVTIDIKAGLKAINTSLVLPTGEQQIKIYLCVQSGGTYLQVSEVLIG